MITPDNALSETRVKRRGPFTTWEKVLGRRQQRKKILAVNRYDSLPTCFRRRTQVGFTVELEDLQQPCDSMHTRPRCWTVL